MNVNWERSDCFLFFKFTVFTEIYISPKVSTNASYPKPPGPLMQTCPPPHQPWQGFQKPLSFLWRRKETKAQEPFSLGEKLDLKLFLK